uniref:Histone domain-containing protein n=1 Tax=Globodera pallida TaxID=36090 RepID=A0A183CBH5_GLOPA
MSAQSSQTLSLSTQGSKSDSQGTVISSRVGGRPRIGAKAKLLDDQEEIHHHKRRRPGTKALEEIRKYQKSTTPLVPREPFRRLVNEIVLEMTGRTLRMEAEAITALQEAAEALLVTVFEAANRCAIHGHRMTVMPSDFALVRWILNAFGNKII